MGSVWVCYFPTCTILPCRHCIFSPNHLLRHSTTLSLCARPSQTTATTARTRTRFSLSLTLSLCFFIQFLRFLIRSLRDSEEVGESRLTSRSATISANFLLRLAFRRTTFPPPRSFFSTDGPFAFLRNSAFCLRLLRLRMSIVNSRYSIASLFCF